MPSQSPTFDGGGQGIIFDSQYRFLAVSLKKYLSGDNYRRPSQLLLTRIVATTELYLLYMIVKLPYGPKSYLLYSSVKVKPLLLQCVYVTTSVLPPDCQLLPQQHHHRKPDENLDIESNSNTMYDLLYV